METVIDGVAYVMAPEQDECSCTGCVCKPTDDDYVDYSLCEKLDAKDECCGRRVIWLKKDNEAEHEVTSEEEEAFRAIEQKKQVGGDHYLKAIQPWDIIRTWELGYWRGNVVKYILRAPYKNGKEDLEKAIHYLQYLIENYDELSKENM